MCEAPYGGLKKSSSLEEESRTPFCCFGVSALSSERPKPSTLSFGIANPGCFGVGYFGSGIDYS